MMILCLCGFFFLLFRSFENIALLYAGRREVSFLSFPSLRVLLTLLLLLLQLTASDDVRNCNCIYTIFFLFFLSLWSVNVARIYVRRRLSLRNRNEFTSRGQNNYFRDKFLHDDDIVLRIGHNDEKRNLFVKLLKPSSDYTTDSDLLKCILLRYIMKCFKSCIIVIVINYPQLSAHRLWLVTIYYFMFVMNCE